MLLLKEIYEKYFLLNLNDYPNIGINLEINKLVLALTLGAIIASLLINYHRSYTYLSVKRMLRLGALNEKSAKTLDELGINKASVRLALSRSGQLTKMIRRVGEPAYSYEEYVKKMKSKAGTDEKINFDTAQFYLDESQLDRARRIGEAGNPSLLRSILFALLLFTIGVCLFLLMPEILTFINGLLAA